MKPFKKILDKPLQFKQILIVLLSLVFVSAVFIFLFIDEKDIRKKDNSSNLILFSIPPLRYIGDQLLEGVDTQIELETLLEEHQNPHSLVIDQKMLKKILDTKIYFSSGLEFENSLFEKINNHSLDIKIVDSWNEENRHSSNKKSSFLKWVSNNFSKEDDHHSDRSSF